VVVRDPGGDHDQLVRARDRDRADHERARVDQQRRSRRGQAACERVHDADRRSDELVLPALGEPRQLDVVDRELEQSAQPAQQRHLQRSARRQARARGQIGFDSKLESIDRESGPDQRCRDALDVIEPAAPARFAGELVLLGR
jgi:hypothetical protein